MKIPHAILIFRIQRVTAEHESSPIIGPGQFHGLPRDTKRWTVRNTTMCTQSHFCAIPPPPRPKHCFFFFFLIRALAPRTHRTWVCVLVLVRCDHQRVYASALVVHLDYVGGIFILFIFIFFPVVILLFDGRHPDRTYNCNPVRRRRRRPANSFDDLLITSSVVLIIISCRAKNGDDPT